MMSPELGPEERRESLQHSEQDKSTSSSPTQKMEETKASNEMATQEQEKRVGWKAFYDRLPGRRRSGNTSDEALDEKPRRERWTMGLLNDRETDEVPGSVLLLSSSDHNEPLGLRNAPARTSASSLPSPYPGAFPREKRPPPEKKRTPDGQIVLDPQPDDSLNDPLNWPAWRRDLALLSLGFYCMVGGGMTPILAAGFEQVADSYGVSIPDVALTTGLYMMGLGIGSVISSPTAILFGKRPVYLVGIILFCLSAIWCALSPSYTSLVIARIVQGISVSPCESLPSATIAEIFFLHERAYRVGIYTLLLLGGKNLVPLVSAAIIQGLSWQWVFWIVAIVVALCFGLLFFFVPETFWDRTPRMRQKRPHLSPRRKRSSIFGHSKPQTPATAHTHHDGHRETFHDAHEQTGPELDHVHASAAQDPNTIAHRRRNKNTHVGFAGTEKEDDDQHTKHLDEEQAAGETAASTHAEQLDAIGMQNTNPQINIHSPDGTQTQPQSATSEAPAENSDTPQTGLSAVNTAETNESRTIDNVVHAPTITSPQILSAQTSELSLPVSGRMFQYTTELRAQPPRTFAQTLKPWNGRLRKDNWLHAAFRPFILFAYPAVLWSTVVYSLSVGWLIVLSESVTVIYGKASYYHFSPLATGLVYLSPFIGGCLGTAVAGKVSDVIVRYMSKRNGGLYEPEFRLVMAIPVAFTTAIGLMGYGWSSQERDLWIVPTLFFGIISFGCSLGSTTAITFCVDSYRQYAGEALVTLNFSKNVLHGLVFSLFFNRWLTADGSKNVFLALGGIQLACLAFTVPMYIYGKRARMWTVRMNFMEKF